MACDITLSEINEMTEDELLSVFTIERLWTAAQFPVLLAQLQNAYIARAKKCGCKTEAANLIKAKIAEVKRDARENMQFVGKGNESDFTGSDTHIACGLYEANDNGVTTSQGDIVSLIPIQSIGLYRNIETGNEKVEIEFRKINWQTIIVDRETIASPQKILSLANKGVEVTAKNAPLLSQYLNDCIQLNYTTWGIRDSVSTLGWHGGEFVPYESTLCFDGIGDNRSLYNAFNSQCGGVSEWVEYVYPLIIKSPKLRLFMAASFASPLIEKLGALPFVCHLFGMTGGGKTVALMCALSVWGDPALGKTVRSLNMTQNAMLSTAAFLNSLPMAGDELQTIKTNIDNYDKLIMTLTEGVDRGRLTADSKMQTTRSWHCAFLFTGEEPISKANSGGGVKNRVIEVEAAENIVENGVDIVRFLSAHHGTAGRLFIEKLNATSTDELFKVYRNYFTALQKSTTDKQASTLALIWLADTLMCGNIFGSKKDIIKDSSYFSQFAKSVTEVDPAERAYDYIVSLITSAGYHFGTYDNVEYWGDRRESTLYFLADILRRELAKQGFDFDAIKEKWAQQDYIIKNNNRYSSHASVNGHYGIYVMFNGLGKRK